MECLKMYYILLNLLIVAIKVSDAVDIEFQGIEPKIVLVGSNVTFRWQYTGEKKPTIIEFKVVKGSSKERLVYYGFGFGATPSPYPAVIKDYATAAVFVGNTSKNEFAFMLVEVKEFSHGKNFSLHIEHDGVIREDYYAEDELFISVLPEVQLWIDETNVSVGDRVTVECRIRQQGRPQAKISWYHDKKLVPGESGRYLFNRKEIELKDAGSYQCVAKNNAGENKSEVIRITVKEKPEEEKPTAGESSGGLGGGAIAGIVIGILLLVLIILVVIYVLLRNKRNKRPKNNKTPSANDDETKSPMVSEPPAKDQVWL